MVDLFYKACKDFGVTISIPKTEDMFQPALDEPYVEPVIYIDGQKLAATDKFVYLGCIMANNVFMSLRISWASASFGILKDFEKVVEQTGTLLWEMLKVYHAVVLPSLLYACES